MKSVVLTFFSSVIFVFVGFSQSVRTPLQGYDAVEFTSVVDTTIVTIETARGERVTFQVPPATCLAIYFSNAEVHAAQAKSFPVTATSISQMKNKRGSLSVRTKPQSDIRLGVDADEQMRVVPLRMDFDDATLTVERKK